MIATVEMLNNYRNYREEYASHFLRRTGDIGKLQAILANHLPDSEILRLANYERELRLSKQRMY